MKFLSSTTFSYIFLPFFGAMPMAEVLAQPAVTSPAPPSATLSQAEALKLILQKTREDTDSGVVMNQLVTVAGQDFYQHFMNAWRDKEGSERYTLVLRERPSARWGSEVWVEYGQAQIYRTRLPISRAAIRQLSEDAAESSFQAVQQADSRRRIAQDADIGIDEF
jgi:curli production assembly/transport component CsgE